MAITIRRRHVEEEFLGAGLSEPLLGRLVDDNPGKPFKWMVENAEALSRKMQRESLVEIEAWKQNLGNLVKQWALWFGDFMKGAGSVFSNMGNSVAELLSLGDGSNKSHRHLPGIVLSAHEDHNLQMLKRRLAVAFDGHLLEHQEALRALWRAAFPDVPLSGMVSQQWKEMGWQGTDPGSDFRGGGFISLENLLHFAYRYPSSFRMLLKKEAGQRAEWEYPFAVAGLNITFMLIQILDLRSDIPDTLAGRRFIRLLGEDDAAFDHLYCVAFMMMDKEWLALGASYMEFNAVLAAVRTKLEYALTQNDVRSVKDLPAFQLLTAQDS
eukprot:TRINITY_DN194_c0_g1_i1.p1 TRINITY_DN194_c0_g1~~TRINITY_DN194_c0_g1_i1.p1  ORF type:complete len:325 (-),score=62.30 TRINITY_DN194_c0_g1_i1:1124-2098(-)